MTVVKYGSEVWTLRKTEEDLQDVLQRKCIRIIFGYLTDKPYLKY